MKETNRANTLLLELLLVILFFMLASTAIVEVFAGARQKSLRSRAENGALLLAQNLSEDLYAAEDPRARLAEAGFTAEGENWLLAEEEYSLKAEIREEKTEAGLLRTVLLTAERNGETLFALPSPKYIPGEVEP